jgi:ABC-type amino acid transport substrate-binding protein
MYGASNVIPSAIKKTIRPPGSQFPRVILFLALTGWLHGCGLLIDAAELVTTMPEPSDGVDVVCRHGRLHVGISVEAYPPFVFAVVKRPDGPAVTGLDLELVQQLGSVLSKQCGGKSIIVVPHVVHFRDLFRLLTEGHLDLFVSSVAYNVPHLKSAGLAYSAPYYPGSGLTAVARRQELVEQIQAALAGPPTENGTLERRRQALNGMIVAVQEGRSAHFYAAANLKGARLLLCDSLAGAWQQQDPPVDIILGKQPVLDFLLKREEPLRSWRPVLLSDGRPFLLNREYFTVVMSEKSFRLHWLVNDLLFELEESGRLATMQRRWFDEDYRLSDRAAAEGLPAVVPASVDPSAPSRCHWAQR